jgi:DNA-binding MarR family transcriptional regulator
MKPGLHKDTSYPTPLLHLTYILQQSSDELLTSGLGAGLASVRIMSTLHDTIPHSQQSVARQLHQTEANVSRLLQVMKKQGLVSITKNKKDHRQRDVKLTAKGKRKYAQAEKLLSEHHSALLKLLAKGEKREFNRAIDSLIKGVLISFY